jgi:protoheme IX farnesyltransferase
MSLVGDGAELSRPLGPAFARAEPSIAGVEDYLALLKPRVMSLVVFTALVGLLVAPGHVHPVIGFTALLCIAIGAGASGALNMWYDADIDAVMTRTKSRPIPAGRVQPGEALPSARRLRSSRSRRLACWSTGSRPHCSPSPSSSMCSSIRCG